LPSQHEEAIIRVYGARTVRWKAIFAIHTWIVVKEANASTYTRYDYTAWGEPIRTNGFAADARWFGAVPETIAAVDGDRDPLAVAGRRVIGARGRGWGLREQGENGNGDQREQGGGTAHKCLRAGKG